MCAKTPNYGQHIAATAERTRLAKLASAWMATAPAVPAHLRAVTLTNIANPAKAPHSRIGQISAALVTNAVVPAMAPVNLQSLAVKRIV